MEYRRSEAHELQRGRPGRDRSLSDSAGGRTSGASTATRRFVLVSGLAIVLVCVAAYGGALRHGFVSDDLHLVVERLTEYRHESPWEIAFSRGFWKGGGYGTLPGEQKDYYRPLVTLSYVADARIWGDRASGYHLTNLILHIAASLLVFRLLRRLGGGQWPALAGALLFAAHPIHVTSVAWISGRTDLLCAVFLLLAYERMAAVVDLRMGTSGASVLGRARDGTLTDTGRQALGQVVWGALFYLLALLSKEMAVVLPGLLVLHVLLRRAQAGRSTIPRPAVPWSRWRPWTEVGVLAGLTVVWILVRMAVLGLPDFAAGARSAEAPFRPGVLPAILGWYWRGFVWPGPLQLVVSWPPIASAADPRVLGGALLLALHVVMAIAGLRRGRAEGLAAGWIVLSLVPVSHIVPLTFRALVTEYWAYIPSIGYVALLALALPAVLRAWPERVGRGAMPSGRLRRPAITSEQAAAALLVVYAIAGVAATAMRARPLKSEEALLHYQIRANPDDAESWLTLATEYGTRGDLPRAFDAIREAVRIDPGALGVQLCLGNLYDLNGQPDSAMAAYRREMVRHPERSGAAANLADMLLRSGEREEGQRIYREILARGVYTPKELNARAGMVLDAAMASRGAIPWNDRRQELLLAAGLIATLEEAGAPVEAGLLVARVGAELRTGRVQDAGRALQQARSAGVALETRLPRLGETLDQAGSRLAFSDVEVPLAEVDTLVRALDGDAVPSTLARDWASFYHETGRTDLAVRLWEPLLVAGAIRAEELNHIAVEAIRAGAPSTSSSPPSGAGGAGGAVVAPGTGERTEDAEAILRMVLRVQPDFPQALLNLGGIAYGAGDLRGCETWWGRFLSLHAGRPEAAAVRERLAEMRRR